VGEKLKNIFQGQIIVKMEVDKMEVKMEVDSRSIRMAFEGNKSK
jgi:hypothetical protein